MNTSNIVGLLIAALGGAAVGLARRWSGHAEGPGACFAGIRTFTMLGAVGGFSGWLWTAGVTAPAAILLAGALAVVAAASPRAAVTISRGRQRSALVVLVPYLVAPALVAALMAVVGARRSAAARCHYRRGWTMR